MYCENGLAQTALTPTARLIQPDPLFFLLRNESVWRKKKKKEERREGVKKKRWHRQIADEDDTLRSLRSWGGV